MLIFALEVAIGKYHEEHYHKTDSRYQNNLPVEASIIWEASSIGLNEISPFALRATILAFLVDHETVLCARNTASIRWVQGVSFGALCACDAFDVIDTNSAHWNFTCLILFAGVGLYVDFELVKAPEALSVGTTDRTVINSALNTCVFSYIEVISEFASTTGNRPTVSIVCLAAGNRTADIKVTDFLERIPKCVFTSQTLLLLAVLRRRALQTVHFFWAGFERCQNAGHNNHTSERRIHL